MLKRILVPLDGSINSEHALKIVNDFSRRTDVDLILMMVVSADYVPAPSYMGGVPVPPQATRVQEEKLKDTTAYLEGVAELEREFAKSVKTILTTGEPPEEIVRVSIEEEVDMIIMLTQGKRFFERLVFGSVTDQVIRGAICPVLAIRGAEMPSHMMITLDGTSFSEQILPDAFQLAGLFDIKVTLSTVRYPEEWPAVNDMTDLGKFSQRSFDHELSKDVREAKEYLESIQAQYQEQASVEIDYDLEIGDPEEWLLKIAERNEVDLIAMVTHGRAGLERFLKGSTTESLMHTSDAAMFVLHKWDD